MPISNARRNYVFGMLVTLYFPNFVDRQNRDAGRRPAHPVHLDGAVPRWRS